MSDQSPPPPGDGTTTDEQHFDIEPTSLEELADCGEAADYIKDLAIARPSQMVTTLIEPAMTSIPVHAKLDQIEEAYALFANQRDGVLKVAITP